MVPKNKTPRQPWIWAEERSPWFPSCSPTPGIASNIRTRPLCRCTLPGRSNYLDKGACHFWIPSTSPYTCTSIQSRGLCSSSTKNAEDNGDNFARCNLGHQLSPRWMLCRTSPCRGRAYSRTMGSATGTTPCYTHGSHRKHYRHPRNNHTELAEKKGVRDVGCCGRITSRDNHPIILVRGSCRVHSVDGGSRFSIRFRL